MHAYISVILHLRQNFGQPIFCEQRFRCVQHAWTVANPCVNQAFYRTDGERFRDGSVEALGNGAAPNSLPCKETEGILESVGLREVFDDEFHDLLHVLFESVDHGVGSSIICICGLDVTGRFDSNAVILHDEGNNCAGHVVHIKDRRVRIERNGVELVGILHRDSRESVKVARKDGFLNGLHTRGYDFFDTVLQEG